MPCNRLIKLEKPKRVVMRRAFQPPWILVRIFECHCGAETRVEGTPTGPVPCGGES